MIDLSSELRAAEEELAFEFSQSDWEDALIFGFKNDLSLACVLAKASGFYETDRKLVGKEWDSLVERAGKLKPALTPHTSLRNRARVWIASHATRANDALWDMNYALAKSLFKKGGVTRNYGAKTRQEVRKENRGTIDNRIFVGARENDKSHDWHTCK